MSSKQVLTQKAQFVLGRGSVLRLGYLGVCAAYLQGGVNKLMNFQGAIAEMNHFGFAPAPLFAVLVIVLELGASFMILFGFLRWLAALALGCFTLVATFIALRFWELPDGVERFSTANSFFEHLGLVGGFILIAWFDVNKIKIRN